MMRGLSSRRNGGQNQKGSFLGGGAPGTPSQLLHGLFPLALVFASSVASLGITFYILWTIIFLLVFNQLVFILRSGIYLYLFEYSLQKKKSRKICWLKKLTNHQYIEVMCENDLLTLLKENLTLRKFLSKTHPYWPNWDRYFCFLLRISVLSAITKW